MMNEQQILKQLNKIKDIPTLPTIIFELNKDLANPDTSIAKVSETIEKDQAMALKILKLVNSAFYGFKSKISNVKSAVVLLGFNAVRNAIVSISIIENVLVNRGHLGSSIRADDMAFRVVNVLHRLQIGSKTLAAEPIPIG